MTSSEDLFPELEDLTRLIHQPISDDNEKRILGPVVAHLGGVGPGRMLLIRSALLSDCLHVAATAIGADGRLSAEEVDFVFPLAFEMARFLSRACPEYRRFGVLDHAAVAAFLALYESDAGPFGKRCPKTAWLGLDLCRRAAAEARDDQVLARYERLVLRLFDDVISLAEPSPAARAARARLRDEITERLLELEKATLPGDARIEAFVDSTAPAVFSSIAYAHQLWVRDPLDVESVDEPARDKFRELVNLVTGPVSDGRGRILLVLGQSGSGKTHLMRVFRTYLHGAGLGYAAYMQMTTRAQDYARYALNNVIDSLERPYDLPNVETSGLMRISDALVEGFGLPAQEIEELRAGGAEPGPGGDAVGPLVDKLLSRPGLSGFDPDLLRAFLALQQRTPAIKARVLKYLRCEHLSAYDRTLLGDIAPRTDSDAPQRTLTEIGRLAWQTGKQERGALVLLVDQLEDIFNLDDAKARFPAAVDVLRRVVDELPAAIVVIGCLDDMYEAIKGHLSRAACDRLERDPAPVRPSSQRTLAEIEELVARRLAHLYESRGAAHREDEPLFPFCRADLEELTNFRTRDVLDWCHRYREACISAGRLVDPAAIGLLAAPEVVDDNRRAIDLEQAWNDFRAGFSQAPPDDNAALLELLACAVEMCAAEDPEAGIRAVVEGDALAVSTAIRETGQEELLLGLCNRPAQGGALSRQLADLEKQAGARRAIALRCSEWPTNPRTKIAEQIGEFLRRGGRRFVVEDSDWRTIMALRAFRGERGREAGFTTWLAAQRPLGRLTWLREILGLHQEARRGPAPPAAPQPQPGRSTEPANQTGTRIPKQPWSDSTIRLPPEASKQTPQDAASVVLGRAADVKAEPVALPIDELRMHAGFLGSTGSGKTTIALHVIEQALARRIPAILVDRKGDLCTYADPAWCQTDPETERARARKQALRERLEVAVYTPGNRSGRDLSLPPVPPGLADLDSQDRNQVARRAAAALAAMMGYRDTAADNARVAILSKAIEVLAEIGADTGFEALIDLIDRQDAVLVNAIGRLDTKHCKKLVDHLETLRLTRGHLLAGDGERLDVGRLLAAADGRTRLSIISTKFLQDAASIEFWVARLLVDLARWASAHPAQHLQALVLLDEADLYVPAQSKPATKEPLQDLLKRARSAGIGLFLATQNPGDLDYKLRENIRTWLLGRITEPRSIGKMKPLLSDCRIDISGRLATQRVGCFFLVREGAPLELKADRALMSTRQLAESEILALARRGVTACGPGR